jgi:hypothetical protein
MRRIILTLVVALVLVFSTVAPAFAFIHVTVPAGECAASDQAGTTRQPERLSCSRTRPKTRRWVTLREPRTLRPTVEGNANRGNPSFIGAVPQRVEAPPLPDDLIFTSVPSARSGDLLGNG